MEITAWLMSILGFASMLISWHEHKVVDSNAWLLWMILGTQLIIGATVYASIVEAK